MAHKKSRPTPSITDPRRLLESAFEQLRAGQLQSAAAAAQGLLKDFPAQPDVLNLAALVALQQGQPQAAVTHLEQAIRSRPDEPVFHCNLGEARRALGQPEQAVAHFRRALALNRAYLTAAINLGGTYFAMGDHAAALTAYEQALASAPDHALLLTYRADALRELGRIRAAVAGYETALGRQPDLVHALTNLGLTLLGLGQPERALALAERAAALEPDSSLARMNLGTILRALDRLEDAMAAYAEAYEQKPDSAQLCALIGSVWQEVDDLVQAHGWYGKALELEPERLDARCGLAGTLRAAGDSAGAVVCYREILGEHPDCFEALLGLGDALWEDGDAEGAVAALQEAAALRPEHAHVLATLAGIQASAGDVTAANASNRAALSINPRCVPALSNLAHNLRGKLPAEDAEAMETLLAAEWPRQGLRATLHFGLAHYYDGRKDYALAAQHAAAGNRLHWQHKAERGWHYDPLDYEGWISRMMAVFTPEFFERTRHYGSDSEAPVFIVGMPRSGTTLTEQILASHPQVFGVGERNFAGRAFHSLPGLLGRGDDTLDCLADAGPEAVAGLADWHLEELWSLVRKAGQGSDGILRIVDKMPDNYSLLGWIAMAFPRARIIHCRRDVRDVALSCWLTQFKELRWAFDLRHIALRIQQYQRIMAHWRRVLPVPMLEIDYEDTVADQAGQTRKLLDFLGLPFDAACLQFHQTERLVRTASVTQVRQPIYTRSLERWRRYEEALTPLLDILC